MHPHCWPAITDKPAKTYILHISLILMKLSLTTSKKCLALLQESSPCLMNSCGCARAPHPPTITPCSSESWRRPVDGMRQPFSAHTGKDWIPVFRLRWLFMMIQLEGFMQRAGRISQRLSATPPKPPTSQPHTHHGFPSTRDHAIGFHTAHSRGARTPPCGWTLPLLHCSGSLHWDLPSQTPTFCGEYPTI